MHQCKPCMSQTTHAGWGKQFSPVPSRKWRTVSTNTFHDTGSTSFCLSPPASAFRRGLLPPRSRKISLTRCPTFSCLQEKNFKTRRPSRIVDADCERRPLSKHVCLHAFSAFYSICNESGTLFDLRLLRVGTQK